MKYSVDKKEQYVIFTLMEEKLDSTISPQLKSELLTVHAEGYRNLILDMSQVKYGFKRAQRLVGGQSGIWRGRRHFRDFFSTGACQQVDQNLHVGQGFECGRNP